MSFLMTILRRSGDYWLALCLENGVVSQGFTKEEALIKMREAIASLKLAFSDDPSLFTAPFAINELHEFLSVEGREPTLETYELRGRFMPKNVPSLKPGELLRILVAGGCSFLRQRALHNCIKPTILSFPRRRLCRNPHLSLRNASQALWQS